MDEDKLIEKAIEETSKLTIGKMVDGVSSFFGKICMPAAEELGLFLKDKIRYYRIKNLYQIISKLEQEIKVEQLDIPVNPRLLNKFVEEASWAADEKLQKL